MPQLVRVYVGGYVFNTEAHPVDAASLYCCSSDKTRDDAAIAAMMTNVDLLSTLGIFNHQSHQPSGSSGLYDVTCHLLLGCIECMRC